MAHAFYPFVDNDDPQPPNNQGNATQGQVGYPARIAVYDDAAAAPRVVVVDPSDIRSYLEEITSQVTALSHEQGGTIPFTVIREIVENLIHAYFIEPTISILDGGNTIRFSDQGPGIKEKARALEYGTSTATEEMKRYIRGVGSGLPYVQQYMEQKGGCLLIEDNLSQGTVVTISTKPPREGAAGDGRHGTTERAAIQSAPQLSTPQYQQVPPATYATQQGWYPQGQYPPQGYQGYPSWQQNGYAPYPQPMEPSYRETPYPPVGQQVAYGQYPSSQGYPPQAYQDYPERSREPIPQRDPYAAAQPQAAPSSNIPASIPPASEHTEPAASAATAPHADQNPFSWITLTERGRTALNYLSNHESVGPSDLQRAYGGSQPTWTRELKLLEDDGLLKKNGQKRHLTNLGHAFVERML